MEYDRDESGDVIFPKSNWDMNKFRRWSATHVFRKYDKKSDFYIPYSNIFKSSDLIEKKKEIAAINLIEIELFRAPEKRPFDNYILFHNYWDDLILNYFKEVFDYDSIQFGAHFSKDIYYVFMPKTLFYEISNFINDFNLLEIRDYIFYLIAKIQKTYIKDIQFYERPEMVEQIKNLPAEVKKTINVIDKTIEKPFKNLKKYLPLPRLVNIKFDFEDGPITLSDPWLNNDIVDCVKRHFDDLPLKDWKKELERYPNRFDENVQKQQFKNRVAIALHNFFKEQKIFKIASGHNTSNEEVNCISKILQYAGLRFTAEPDVMLVELNYNKNDIRKFEAANVKIVRNWLKRNELKQYPTEFECRPDYDLLYKYFDKKFIDCTLPYKRINTLFEALYFIKRFDISLDFAHTFAHLYDCLVTRRNQIGHQFSPSPWNGNVCPEVKSFQAIINAANTNTFRQNIKEVSFTIDGVDKPQIVTEKLPTFVIKQALAEYFENHKEEFEFDLIETEINDNPVKYSFEIKSKAIFKQPEDRFLPQFCKSFYSLLLEVLPPSEAEYRISEKYHTIIGLFLNKSWIFGHQRTPEYILTQKVAEWLHLFKQ